MGIVTAIRQTVGLEMRLLRALYRHVKGVLVMEDGPDAHDVTMAVLLLTYVCVLIGLAVVGAWCLIGEAL